MKGINKCIIVGTCGKDPETKFMPSGKAVTNISVATSEQWKDKQTGQKQEATEWHNVVFFDRLAEIAGEYLKKGAQVYIEGKIKTEKYEKDGVARYSTKIIAKELQMLGGKLELSQGAPMSQVKPAQQQTTNPNDYPFDDNLPF